MGANNDLAKELEEIISSFRDLDPLYFEPNGTVNDISIPYSGPETTSNFISSGYEEICFDFGDFEQEKFHLRPAGSLETPLMPDDPLSNSQIVEIQYFCEDDPNYNEPEKSNANKRPFEAVGETKAHEKYFTWCEVSLLESFFLEDPEPSNDILRLIAETLGTNQTRIKSWFQKKKFKRKIQSKGGVISPFDQIQNQNQPDGYSFVTNVRNEYLRVRGTSWKDIATDLKSPVCNNLWIDESLHGTFKFSGDTLSYHSQLHLNGCIVQITDNNGNSDPEINVEEQLPDLRQNSVELATCYEIAETLNVDCSWDIVDENFDPCNESWYTRET